VELGALPLTTAATPFPSAAGGLPLTVAGVVLVAAVAHAAWNSIAHGIKDKLVAFTLVSAGAGLFALPLLFVAAPPDPRSWPYLGVSVLVHNAYNLLLMRSYRLGDFGQVYPFARGMSPLLVTMASVAVLGETPSGGHVLGVLLISAGLASLVLAGHRRGPVARPALLAAAGTGLAIATYTTVDGVGVRLAGSSLGYTGWLMVLHCSVIPVGALALRRGELLRQVRPVWHVGLVGGLASTLAYGLVLWAQTRGALGPVAALRETSVIFGAVIGTVLFHEPFGRARIIAATLVATGIVLLNLP
jgi:drug/metabolite transporter (DMT)-like permease